LVLLPFGVCNLPLFIRAPACPPQFLFPA
jgi:hypothetical protein